MDIKKRDFLGLAAGVGAAAAMTATAQAQPAPRTGGPIQVGQRGWSTRTSSLRRWTAITSRAG